MKRLALILLPVLLLGACRDNGASVQIQTVCAFPSSCTFSNKCDKVTAGNLRMDPTLTETLKIMLQLENQLPDNSDRELKRLNTNDAHVDRVEVEYGGLLGGKVTQAAQAYIPAGTVALVYVDLVPVTVGATITGAPAYPSSTPLTANVRFMGYFDDGTRFETAQFPLTIEVAVGGTITCATSYCPQAGQLPAACGT
jgi:hypothetical protein